jgi:cytochrome c556
MRMPTRWLLSLAALWILGFGLLVAVGPGAAADKDEKVSPEQKAAREQARQTVEQLADMVGDDKKAEDVQKKAKELAEKMMKADFGVQAVEPIMAPLKLRTKGGMGIGAKPGVYDPDGIEAKIIGLAKKKLTAAELKNQADDIAKLAKITAAVAEVSELHKPEKKVGDKRPEDWAKWSKEMRDSALELANQTKAIKPDPDAIKKTATKLNGTCTDCHDKFRPK